MCEVAVRAAARFGMVWNAGFALLGESLFLVWPRKSNQKEGHPNIRVLLRKTPLPPALLRGPARRAIRSASMPRVPLRSTYARPPEGDSRPSRLKVVNSETSALRLFADEQAIRRRRSPHSGGRMESARRGASGMDAARGVKGRGRRRHGWSLRGDPRSSLVGWVQPIKLLRWASPILRCETRPTMLRLLISDTGQQTTPNAPSGG